MALQYRTMLLYLRKILFYLLLGVYLILTPYLILYGLGYGFNAHEGEIFKTGLISITSEPKGASIYIEGRRFSQKTPAVLRGLLPGSYHVKVSLKGFESWGKDLTVLPEKATRIDPVVLLPLKPEVEALSTHSYWNLLPKMSDFKLAALQGNHLADFKKIDLLFKKETAGTAPASAEIASHMEILDWKGKEGSNAVLFRMRQNGREGYLFFDLEKGKILKDFAQEIPGVPDLTDWDVKNPRYFYYLINRKLTGFDLEKKELFEVSGGEVLGFGINRRKLYVLKGDYSLWQGSLRGDDFERIPEKESLPAAAFQEAGAKFYSIDIFKREWFQKELILFMGDSGQLLSNWPPHQLLARGVRGIRRTSSGDSEKILYWTDSEIGMYDFSFNSEEDENMPPKRVLYRSGADLRQAVWAFENSHILFQDKNELFLLEAGDASPYLVRAIQSVSQGTDFLYNDHQHSVYFLSMDGKKVSKRKVTE